MRLALLLGLGSLVTVTAVACSDAGSTELTGRRLRAPSTAADDDAEHDETEDDDGAVDPGNPNASTTPKAPGTPGTTNAQFGLTLSSATPVVGLGESTEIEVRIEPKNGFVGSVDVSVAGLPAGATAAPVQATATSPAKLVIRTEVTAVATPPDESAPLVITGTSGSLVATVNANFKIAPKLTLTIPVNIDALRAAGTQYRDQWGAAFGANPQPLKTQAGNGVVVSVFNADSKPHVIHGANGFAHGNTGAPIQPNAFEMANGAVRTRTLNPGANVNGYPHDGSQGSGASFRIRVEAAN